MVRQDSIVSYFHRTATPHSEESVMEEQPVLYEGHQVGSMQFVPDGNGHIDMIIRDPSGAKIQVLESGHDPAMDEK